MKRPLLRPCAIWAEHLAALHPTDLACAERAALAAHLAICPACVAALIDYRRMDAQIRRLPDLQPRAGLPPRLLQLWAEEDRCAGSRQPVVLPRVSEAFMQTSTNSGAPSPTPTPLHNERRTRRRLISGITAIAAVLIITIVTFALFASHAGKPTLTGSGNHTATPTPGNRGWQSVPTLTNLSAQPLLAPGNPLIVYEADAHLTILRRSDDDGAHWKNLPLPTQASQMENANLQINPGDAQNIFLILTFAQSSSACSGSQAPADQITAYSGNSCQVQYYSTDGGANWGLMRWNPQTGQTGVVPVGSIVAQKNHLYSLYFDQNQHQRLITSTDAGATWQFADDALRAQGQGMCSFAAAPTGSTVFVLAQVGSCSQAVGYRDSNALSSQVSSGLAVWLTDDAGAHWTQAGGFPFSQPDTQAFMAFNSGGAQPTLFAAAGQANSYTRLVSTDGGKTWQPLPTQGIPANVTFLPDGVPLSDGSILAVVTEQQGNAASLYAWKPGDQAWHQVTPAFVGDASDLTVSSADGHDTIWLTTEVNYSSFTVYKYILP